MNRKYRLKGESDFNRVRRFGKAFSHPLFVLKTLENGLDHFRVGIICSRLVGNAVHRNLIRRRLRTCMQESEIKIKPGFDLVWITKKGIHDAGFSSMKEAVSKTLEGAGLL